MPAIEALIPLAHDAAALASFTPGQMLAVFIALLFLIISGFVSGSEIAYFSLTQQQIDDLQENPKALLSKNCCRTQTGYWPPYL